MKINQLIKYHEIFRKDSDRILLYQRPQVLYDVIMSPVPMGTREKTSNEN